MDYWIAILLSCSGLSLLWIFHTYVVNAISARAQIAAVPDPRQRKRFTLYIHLAVVSFVVTTPVFVVLVSRTNSAALAGGGFSQPVAETCPCPEAKPQTTEKPTKEIETNSATSSSFSQRQATHSVKETNFLIDAIRYDYSHNALMGRFHGRFLVENGRVKFIIPNPVFRLAGRHQIRGQRTITGVKVGIADYEELIRASRGQEGNVIWSDPFEFTATRDHREEYAESITIELSVPVRTTDLKGKAVLVQIDNQLTSSGKTLEPSYAISGREIFY
jgi:hypothetical protein